MCFLVYVCEYICMYVHLGFQPVFSAIITLRKVKRLMHQYTPYAER